MTSPHLRDRYLQDSINTASPGKLLMMLYDRLVRDLHQSEDAIRAGDRDLSSDNLKHAQDIVVELLTTLDVEAWAGAPGLAGLYSFLLTEMIGANISQDAERVAVCRQLVEPLRDAWREAAAAAVAG
ncbi:flagellar export chaperone FliS [Micromonosporaceae bacterium Da 78-11]